MVFILAFAGISGVNDGGNLIGTYLSSKSLKPLFAVLLLSLSVLAGPFLFGTQVSHTIAVEIVNFQVVGPRLLAAALAGTVSTLGVAWWRSVPTTATLALAGSMTGAALADGHLSWIEWGGVLKVALGVVGSVVVGFMVAYLVYRGLRMIMARYPKLGFEGGKMQWISIVLQGLVYGANDQEKVIGLTALLLLAIEHHTGYYVGWSAIVVPWAAWVAGLLIGGLRIAKTVNGHIVRLNDVVAVSAQLGAALTVGGASFGGLPVSSTQTTDGSLFGAGAAVNPYQVRWGTLGRFFRIWVMTLPLGAAFGGLAMVAARVTGVV